jgi:hypothetical protein
MQTSRAGQRKKRPGGAAGGRRGWLAGVAVVAAALPVAALAEPPADFDVRSRLLADRYMNELREALQDAMQTGGPIAAIEVCRVRAPQIAAEVSAGSGARVDRTALRVRNPSAAPDEVDAAVLRQFAAELQAGAPPPDPLPEAVYVLRRTGGVEGRYLRAIPTQPLCVTCHGATLAPEIAAAVRKAYPDDAAIGFAPGELRGAVRVRWPAGD